MGRVGQQVINCFWRNCLKTTVDLKLSADWLEKEHNSVIKLSITKEIYMCMEIQFCKKTLQYFWGTVEETQNLEKISGFKYRKK